MQHYKATYNSNNAISFEQVAQACQKVLGEKRRRLCTSGEYIVDDVTILVLLCRKLPRFVDEGHSVLYDSVVIGG